MQQLTCFHNLKKFHTRRYPNSIMSTRSRAVIKQARPVNPMKRQLDFSDEPSDELDSDLLRQPIWKTSRSYRVDFGETNPSMQLRCLGE